MRQRAHKPKTSYMRPHFTYTNTSYEGDAEIDGLPIYHQHQAPGHLATQNQLDQAGLKRATDQKPDAWLWVSRFGTSRTTGRSYSHWTPVALYDKTRAIPKRKMSERQRQVLENAREQAEISRDLGSDATEITADLPEE